MKKKVCTVVLTVLLFLSAAAIGVSGVFRVDAVALVGNLSEQGQMQTLKTQLEEEYKDESMFSLTEEKAQALLKAYPYCRLISFKKVYPNKVVLEIVEDSELYAVETGQGEYYVLTAEGIIVGRRNTPLNRLDDQSNVLVQGLQVTGEKGGYLSGDSEWQSMFALGKAIDESLGGIRGNVLSLSVFTRTPEIFYRITMREGVSIFIGEPSVLTEEKAKAAMDKYLSLSDSQRMIGRINVLEAGGSVYAEYKAE